MELGEYRITTERLRIEAADLSLAIAEKDDLDRFIETLRVDRPESWPPEMIDDHKLERTIRRLEEAPAARHWGAWYIVGVAGDQGGKDRLIGRIGLHGGPDDDGEVEFEVVISESHRRRGYATEAIGAFLRHLMRIPDVQSIASEVLQGSEGPRRLLSNLGFLLVGQGRIEGVVRYRLARDKRSLPDRARLAKLATETPNPRSSDLDLLDTLAMMRVMNEEDRRPAVAVGEVLEAIAKAVDCAADRLSRGGTLHYFGAGTSGRLGVLDAAECPPTFGVSADIIVGHMAGGEAALIHAMEGAEDDRERGRVEVAAASIGEKDVVCALSASGRTPYAIGVLEEAAARGAATVAIVCNRPTPMHAFAQIVIDPVTGEEVLSGSTRLKAGTAQKLCLNMLSTGVMVRLGKTYGNLMVGVRATNEKLRDRARRLVEAITKKSEGVRAALESADFDVRVAVIMIEKGVAAPEAKDLLDRAGGMLRRVLDQKM